MIAAHLRRGVLEELRACAAPDGSVPPEVMRRLAAQAGITRDHLRRIWVADKAQRRGLAVAGDSVDFAPPGKFIVTQHHLAVIAAHGCLKEAWRELSEAQPGFPSYSQFCRATEKQVDGGVRAALLGAGAKELESRRLYLQQDIKVRNTVWELDAQQIPVKVIGERGKLVKPWQTSVIDAASRVLLATVITEGRPTGEITQACLVKAILGSITTLPDGQQVFAGGLPGQLVVDNGGEVTSDAVQAFATRHGLSLMMTNPYSGWEKGRIESWHRTIETELYSSMPGFTHGPKTFTRTPVWDPSVSAEGASVLMPFELLVEQTLNWIDEYNATRVHSQLAGRAPLEVWAADPRPLTTVSRDLLVDDMLPGDKDGYRIDKAGIRFHKIDWQLDKLNGKVGQKAQVRWLPQLRPEDDFIAVFVNGELLGYGKSVLRRTEAERRALLRERRKQYDTWRRAVRDGEKMRARRADEALKTGTAGANVLGQQPRDSDAVVSSLLSIFAGQPSLLPVQETQEPA